MSYEHCDAHDEDATNGCLSCDREQVAAMSVAEVLIDAAHMLYPGHQALRERILEIAKAMASAEQRLDI